MNIRDLRNDLLSSFQQLKEGRMEPQKAKEITNLAGKIIISAKTELDYNRHMDIKRKIDFLDCDDCED